MSIIAYTGTPGSGKSLNAARAIMPWLQSNRSVIANFEIKQSVIDAAKRKHTGDVICLDNSELTVGFLVGYAMKYLKRGIESQCLIVIDEAGAIFNKEKVKNDKMDMVLWRKFFTQHRKYGYDILIITQSLRSQIDSQLRSYVETETVHRKMNQCGMFGWFVSLVFRRSFFLTISKWNGANGMQLGKDFFMYRKSLGKMYDSFKIFTDFDLTDGLSKLTEIEEERLNRLTEKKRVTA